MKTGQSEWHQAKLRESRSDCVNSSQTVEVGQIEQPQVILHEFRSDCVEAGQSEWPQAMHESHAV